MKIFYVFVLIEIFISSILRVNGFLTEDNYYYSIGIIILTTTVLLILLYKKLINRNCENIYLILIVGYFLRVLLIFYDVFIVNIADKDVDTFHNGAVLFVKTGQALVYGSKYSFTAQFFGLFYQIFGIQRILLQYFNTLLIIFAGLIIYSVLESLNINRKYINISIIFFIFSPQCVLSSVVTSREAEIIFLLSASLYFFIGWLRLSSFPSFFVSISFVLLGSLFHSGVIGIAIGYILVLLLYNPDKNTFQITIKTISLALIVLGIFLIIYAKFGTVLFAKFGSIESISDIASYGEGRGGSAYNVGSNNVSSIKGLIVYSPLRIIYFLLSPVPWNWRGISDIIAFFSSSFVYFLIVSTSIKAYQKSDNYNKNMILVIWTVILMGVIIFAWGVSNAGTAIRHREKFIEYFVILLGLSLGFKKERESL